jgi:hypothetical protein
VVDERCVHYQQGMIMMESPVHRIFYCTYSTVPQLYDMYRIYGTVHTVDMNTTAHVQYSTGTGFSFEGL